MDNVISIVNTKPSEFDFELGVDGLSPKKMKVCFYLKASDHYLMFECKKSKGDSWMCKIPALPHLDKGVYPFHIDVVADGYHFEVMKGTANITGSFDVYVKKAEKIKPGKETKKDEKGKAEKKTEKGKAPKKTKEASDHDFSKAANILGILAESKKSESNASVDVSSKSKINDIVRKILEEQKNEKHEHTSSFKFRRGREIG